ncbi:MAG: RNase P modulator RnpM [bacterium]
MRTCVACGRTRPKRELLRVVRTPDGQVRLDPTGKVSGRGAYVCAESSCADAGLREARLAHALEVAIPADVAAQLRTRSGAARGQMNGAYH